VGSEAGTGAAGMAGAGGAAATGAVDCGRSGVLADMVGVVV
jgi:hypothetical protein